MTSRQITKKLEKAGISLDGLTIERDQVEIYIEQDGICDYDKTEKKEREVNSVLKWGGFKAGYGSWILQANYESLGDWNDVSSRHHY